MVSCSPGFLLLLSLVALSSQQSEGIDCYDWAGDAYSNNTQCPGSRVCCNTASLCTPNRFCVANNQTIVPVCAVYPWSDCSNICQYVTGTGFLPRVTTCSDGSFCCDNDPTCCADNRGIVLDGLGAIVSTDDGIVSTSTSSSTTTSTSSTTTSTISSATTTSSSSSNTPTSTSSLATATAIQSSLPQPSTSTSGLTSAAKIGIGIGVAALVVLLAIAAYLVRARRRRSRTPKNIPPRAMYSHEMGPSAAEQKHSSMAYHQQTYSHPVEKPADDAQIYEMPGQTAPRTKRF